MWLQTPTLLLIYKLDWKLLYPLSQCFDVLTPNKNCAMMCLFCSVTVSSKKPDYCHRIHYMVSLLVGLTVIVARKFKFWTKVCFFRKAHSLLSIICE